MRHNQIIRLISSSISTDEIGNQIQILAEREICANEFSVGSSEFYNAATAGLKPAKVFEIYSFEYFGEELLMHSGIAYHIIRTEGKGEKTRLSCERATAYG